MQPPLYSLNMRYPGGPLLVVLLASPFLVATSYSSFDQVAKSAQAAQDADRLNQAISLYRQGLHLKTTWSDGWWSLGSILYDQDRFPEAQDAFQHFVATTPKPGPGYAFLGLCEYETHDYDHALGNFRAWARNGWSGTPQLIDVAVFHFALLLTREGNFVQALYLLAAEVEKSHAGPAMAEAMGLASLHMRYLPTDYPVEQREAVWLAGQAAMYAAMHPADFRRANEYAHRLATHYDETPNVHYFLGTLRKFQSDDAGAASEYERELQISPKHASAMTELAELDLADNQLEKALELAKKASEIEPENSEAHRIWGEALLKSGNVSDSVRELETAKRLAPDSATVRFQLAAAYHKSRRPRDADRELAAFNTLKDKEMILPASPKSSSPQSVAK